MPSAPFAIRPPDLQLPCEQDEHPELLPHASSTSTSPTDGKGPQRKYEDPFVGQVFASEPEAEAYLRGWAIEQGFELVRTQYVPRKKRKCHHWVGALS
jgi:hypothetical protein